MRHLVLMLALVGCATTTPAVRVETVTVTKEIQRPCPVKAPVKPGPLARPLPTDAARIADVALAKLLEYAGPGGYAERADAAIRTCTKP